MGLPQTRHVRMHEALLRDTWVETDTQDNAIAEATRAAEAGKRHFIVAVIFSHDDEGTPADVSIQHDGVEQFILPGTERGAFFSGVPISVPENTAVSAELAASGSPGVSGTVTLIGFTVDSDEV